MNIHDSFHKYMKKTGNEYVQKTNIKIEIFWINFYIDFSKAVWSW